MASSFRRLAAACLALALAAPAAAQPVLVGDLAPQLRQFEHLRPRHLQSLGELAVFQAEDRHGLELWRSDGTVAGTWLLADLCPGPCHGDPLPLGAVGRHLFFSARLEESGDLWLLRTDGTVEGTITLGGPLRGVEWLGETGDRAVLGLDVHRPFGNVTSDSLVAVGTEGVQVEVLASLSSVRPSLAVESGGRVFLGGSGLWISDGTSAGTREIAHDFPLGMAPVGRGVVFWRANGELMFSDGGDPRTLAQGDRLDGIFSEAEAAPAGEDRVYFVTRRLDGHRLWVTDGTLSGSRRLPAPLAVEAIHGRAGRAYFSAGDGLGFELWTSDGTPIGTRRVADLCPGACSTRPRFFTPFGRGVLFVAEIEPEKLSLWYAEGTATPRRLLDGESSFFLLAMPPILDLGDALFVVWAGSLWRIDNGLRVVRIAEAGGDSLAAVGPWVLFSNGPLWRTDGTAAGSAALPVVGPHRDDGSHPQGFVELDGRACFFALGFVWCSGDGTVESVSHLGASGRLAVLGGRLIAVTERGVSLIAGAPPEDLVSFGGRAVDVETTSVVEDRLFFFTFGAAGAGLWTTDGTKAGTRLVRGPLQPRSAGVPVGGRLVFVALGVTGEVGVWSSDGTFEGTFELPVDLGFQRVEPVSFRGAAWIAGERHLWRSDGSTAGTLPVLDLPPHSVGSGLTLFATRDRLLIGGESSFVDKLWSTDGMAPVQELLEAERLDPDDAVALGDRLFFSAGHPELGRELWVTDGTAGGTRTIDLLPGPAPSMPRNLTVVGEHVLFAARRLGDGDELWASDGTPAGTRRLFDLAPGPASSSPSGMTRVGDRLYFAADDGTVGQEPWAVDWERVLGGGGPCEPTDSRLCLGGGRFAVTVRWRDHINGGAGSGHAMPLRGSDQTGTFWFFHPDNVELIVKALDGTPVNGHHWLFYGALSTVEYWIDVLDTATGDSRRYHNPAGEQCGRGDTTAFAGALAAEEPRAGGGAAAAAAPATACGDEHALCLLGGSLAVEVDWHDPRSGDRGRGVPIPGSDNTGTFWFFDSANVELVVKALDGTTVNGHRWVFYGGLSDVEYDIRVTETATGAVRTYRNPFGEICGGADTTAF